MRPPGSPRRGDLAGSNTSEPRGSAPRERDHRGGDHPVPSRTRQLSPPSPRVLQRKAAGGQGVALAEGAFLCLRGSAREEMCGGAPHAPGEARGGDPLRAFPRFGPPAPASDIFGGCAFPFGRHRGGDAACAPKGCGETSTATLFCVAGGKLIRWCRRRCAAIGPARELPCRPFLLARAARCCDSRCMRSVKSSLA